MNMCVHCTQHTYTDEKERKSIVVAPFSFILVYKVKFSKYIFTSKMKNVTKKIAHTRDWGLKRRRSRSRWRRRRREKCRKNHVRNFVCARIKDLLFDLQSIFFKMYTNITDVYSTIVVSISLAFPSLYGCVCVCVLMYNTHFILSERNDNFAEILVPRVYNPYQQNCIRSHNNKHTQNQQTTRGRQGQKRHTFCVR